MSVKRARTLWKSLLTVGALITVCGKLWLPFLILGSIIMFCGIFVLARYYKCPHCGKTLGRENGNFCPYCGKSLGD